MIKAIETVYNGYRFRSRLEARWAVFFDTLGVKYEYEHEGFDLGHGQRYLPDFHFSTMQFIIYGSDGWLKFEAETYLEVKPIAELSKPDTNKMVQFAKSYLPDSCLLVCFGDPLRRNAHFLGGDANGWVFAPLLPMSDSGGMFWAIESRFRKFTDSFLDEWASVNPGVVAAMRAARQERFGK